MPIDPAARGAAASTAEVDCAGADDAFDAFVTGEVSVDAAVVGAVVAGPAVAGALVVAWATGTVGELVPAGVGASCAVDTKRNAELRSAALDFGGSLGLTSGCFAAAGVGRSDFTSTGLG